MEALSVLHQNQYVSTMLTTFLVLYGALARPELPSGIRKLFDNQIFRIIVLAFIAYRGNKDPQLALAVAVAFVVTMNLLAEQEVVEKLDQVALMRYRKRLR